jgi:hypothetical protein
MASKSASWDPGVALSVVALFHRFLTKKNNKKKSYREES